MLSSIIFIAKSVIISGVLVLYYWTILRNKSFHSFNRFYLLSTLLLSLIIPLIPLQSLFRLHIPKSQSFNNVMAVSKDTTAPTAVVVLFGIGILVSLILLAMFLARIIWIYRLKSRGVITPMDQYTFIETDDSQAPFSFLSNLFWRPGLSKSDDFGKKIYQHELTHIRQKHTYDKLFSQIITYFFWINPFYWIIQKELDTVHEFLADAGCIEQGNKKELATMLLYGYNQGKYLSPSHSFFSSSLARRLHAIGLSEQSKMAPIRKIMVIPLAILIISGFTVSFKTNEIALPPENNTKPIERKVVKGYKIENLPVVEGYKIDDLPAELFTGETSDNVKIVIGQPLDTNLK